MQVESFLVRFPPFDPSSRTPWNGFRAATEIEFFPRGTTILQQGGPPSRFLYVVRTGGVELLDDEVVIDLLEEGEMFGHPSLVAGLPPTFSVRAFEDTICYLIDRQVAEEVIGTRSGIEFLARGLARRSRQMALASETGADRLALPSRSRRSCTGTRSGAPRPSPSGTRRRRWRGKRSPRSSCERTISSASSTDRDLRTKVVAEGRDLSIPVSEVMTTPVITVRDDAMADEALRLMLQHGIHHLPVTGAGWTSRRVSSPIPT